MCSKLCPIYYRTVIIVISIARNFIGWPNDLNCLNVCLILLQFKKKMKKKSEFNETLFFLLYLLSKLLFMYPMISFPQIKKISQSIVGSFSSNCQI